MLQQDRPALSAAIDEYMADCYALAQGTQELYRYHLDRLLADVGDPPLSELDPHTLRRFFAELRRVDGGEYSAHYVDQVYRTLKTFLSWCAREGLIEHNPLDAVRRQRVPHRKSPRLSLGEIERLLAAVRQTDQAPRNLAMIYLMLDSGLRRGEVLGLTLADVDLPAGVIVVYAEKTHESREVPISAATCETLRSYLTFRPSSDSGAVFVTRNGGPLTKNGLQSLMYRLKDRAGLPDLGCHLLRHTFANHYINGGGGLRKLQKILGHADISLTARIYTDPELSELQAEHQRVSPLVQLAKRSRCE